MAATNHISLSVPDPRPFVKWAGGKSALIAQIAERFPAPGRFERYIEPFLGAGALFYYVRRCFPDMRYRIGDSNAELINAYRVVRDHVEALISKLETHSTLHSEEHYYNVRSRQPSDSVERAARFIYLNRTCYNGLYRVNRRGHFNVPMGRYDKPRIVDRQNLLAVSAALEGVELRCSDYAAVVEDAASGDLVYLDPPYQPASETSSFTSYTTQGFGEAEQRRLARTFEGLTRSGTNVILSNSDTALVRELYGSLRPRPRIDVVEVPRSINSNARARSKVRELLIYYPVG